MKWLAMLVLVAGCAKPGLVQRGDAGSGGNDLAGGGGQDSGATDDLSTPYDLAGRDFAGADLTSTTPNDLAGQCVLLPQSGCGAGEKCTYDGTGNTCVSNGNVATGGLCGAGGSDNCVAGDECVSSGGGTISDCRQFCTGDATDD